MMAILAGLAVVLTAAVATPAAAQSQVLFSDNFEGGAGAWTTADGSWSVQGPAGSRVYHQSNNSGNARSFAGQTSWTDVSVEASVRPGSFNAGSGSALTAVLARVQGNQSYYYLTLRNNNQLEINKLVNGSRTLLASTSQSVQTGVWYALRLDLAGDQLTGFLNGQPLVSATDSQFSTGRAGLKTFNATADFDDVLVTDLEVDPPDPTEPPEGAVFYDDFSDGAGNWSTSGGSWAVTGNQKFRQGSSSGNARAFAGDPTWDNITVEAEVTPLSGSGSSSFTAALGRVQGTQSYYYLTLRNNGRLEINKLVNGSRTELAGTSFGVSNGTTYTLRLEMWFDQLTAYVNGQQQLTATDGQFDSGRIGLATFNATAEFDEVAVFAEVDTEPPTAPGNLRATGVTSSSVSLAWTASTDNDQVAGYDVYRVGSPDQVVATTTDTSAVVTGLSLGQTYSFYVRAFDRSGNPSAPSNTVSATTAAPAPPSNLQAGQVSATSVELSWSPSPDHDALDRYDVFRAGSPNQLVGSAGGTFFLVTGLSEQTTYSFFVVARDTGGVPSSPSNQVTVTTGQLPPVPPVDHAPGYASLNGGTTGGFGHDIVTTYVVSQDWPGSGYSSPGEAIYQWIRSHRNAPANEGLVIYVDMTITENNFGRSKFDITDAQNVSILGVSAPGGGTLGEFDGVGWTVRRANNIVFRNLKIHHVRQGEGTAIELTDNSHHVWIDHNEFYSELENAPDKDYYDGLVDIKRNAEYVTVSWNYFHDHWKTMLLGHNDNESLKPDKVTYMNNWFRNVNSRTPLIRFAEVHLLNNYFQDVQETAINSRMGAQVLVEGNYFENVGDGGIDSHAGHIRGPVGWWYGSSQTGFWNLVNNVYVNTPHEHLQSTTNFTVPYQYTALNPADARTPAVQQSGVGKITTTP